MIARFLPLVILLCLFPPGVAAQQEADLLDGRAGRDLALGNFRPRAMLKVSQHEQGRARFPVVDVHTHFRYRLHHSPEQLDEFVRLMDRHQIAVCVSLHCGCGAAAMRMQCSHDAAAVRLHSGWMVHCSAH